MQGKDRLIDITLVILALLGPVFHLAGLAARGLAMLYSDYTKLGITYGALAVSSAAAMVVLLRRQGVLSKILAGLALVVTLVSIIYVSGNWTRDMRQALSDVSIIPIETGKVGILVAPANGGAAALARTRAIEKTVQDTFRVNGLEPYTVVRHVYTVSSEKQALELAQRLRANIIVWERESSSGESYYYVSVLGADETSVELEPISLMLLMATQHTVVIPNTDAANELRLANRIVAPIAAGFGALAVGRPLVAAAQYQNALGVEGLPQIVLRALHNDMGLSLMYAGRPDLAIKEYEQANGIEPNAASWTGIGIVWAMQRDWSRARDAFNRAIALDPYSATAYCGLGAALARDRDVARAAASYRQAAGLSPSWGIPYAFLGLAYELEGNAEGARDAYRVCAEQAGPNAGLQVVALQRAEDILRNPPTAVPTATPPPRPTITPIPTSSIYIVQRGDTLRSIAEEFDVTMEKIIEVNQISDPNTLTVGQTIIIPSKPPKKR